MADGDAVHFMDLSEEYLDANGDLSIEIMPDFLHLSEQGYRIWAEAIESKVRELLGE